MVSKEQDLDTVLGQKGGVPLQAGAPTDIWRLPPNLDVFNAPLIPKFRPISSFKSIQVSATGDWLTLYDQGGIVIALPPKKTGTQRRWIKAGIEFYNNKPRMSVVAADEWADWSLSPLSAADESAGRMTVVMERENLNGEWTSILRVSMIDEKGEKLPIREVTWAFHDVNEDEEMMVALYAAKPTKDDREFLVVNFDGIESEERV